MTHARRPARRAALRSSRRISSPRRDRRALFSEPLETRAMLAADWLVSDYWNGTRPADVNADGAVSPLDALVVVNDINQFGSYAVMGPSAAPPGGEGEDPASGGLGNKMYRDTNNDGMVSPIDALLVFNQLNAEGETALMRYQIQLFQPGTVNPLPMVGGVPTLQRGQDYDLVVTVKDDRVGGRGVFAGYIDVNYNSSLTRVKVSEIQHIVLDEGVTSGTFTLSFNGQGPTSTLNFNDLVNPSAFAGQIQLALEGLSNINPGDIEVSFDPIAASGGQPAVSKRWQVRFTGQYLDQNVAQMTLNGSFTGGPTPTGTVVTTAQGIITDPIAFREAFRGDVIPLINPNVLYVNALNAGNLPNKIDDVGAVATGSAPFPGTFPAELVRARMTTTNAGMITFMPDLSDIVVPAHDTLIYDRNTALATMEISIGTNVVLNITEDVSANDDTVNINEDSGAITFNPLIAGGGIGQAGILADTTSLPGTLQIRSNTNASNGTVSRTGNSITYTPNLNFSGTDTFTYTIGIGAAGGTTDTATVTINVAAVNDIPTITILGGTTRSTGEDATLNLFPPSNDITINDDSGTSNITVTLTIANGTAMLGSTTGVTPTGNGSSLVTIVGPLAAINASLDTLSFTPTLDSTANGTISINVNDGGNTGSGGPLQANAAITVTITASNDKPVNNNVPTAANVDEGSVLTFSPAISVTDVDAGATTNFSVTLSVTAGTGILNVPAGAPPTITGNGTANLSMTGTLAAINAKLAALTFTPATGFIGNSTFTITSNDNGATGAGGAQSDTDTTTISVDPTVRPRARADSPTFAEVAVPVASSYRMNVMLNDVGNLIVPTPLPPNPTTFPTTLEQIFTTLPANIGQLVIFTNNTPEKTDDQIDFIPADPNFFGTVTFTYGIWDTASTPPATLPANAIAQVTLNITNVNDPPDAVNDSRTTPEDTPIDINVLANDTDPDNNPLFGTPQPRDTLTVAVTTNPTRGTVENLGNGVLRYTPTSNLNGPDSFTYTISDGNLSDTATVNIDVTPVNDAPIAQTDTFNPTEDGPLLTVAAPGVLGNDTDPDNLSPPLFAGLSAVLVTGPTHGILNLNADGSFTYQPNDPNFDETDTFTYRARDGQNAESAVTTVNLVYIAVNDQPVAGDDLNFTMEEDTSRTFTGLLANDVDVDGDTLTVSLPVTIDAANQAKIAPGGLVVRTNGSFDITPIANFTGTIEFTYRATDGPLLSNFATVRVTVTEFNDPPTAVADSASTNEDTFVDINVVSNDIDQENSPLSPIIATNPARGTVTLVGNLIRYTPNPDFFGSDSFTYRVSDGDKTSVNAATVSITVNEVNDAPVAVNDGPFLVVKDFVDQEISVLGNDFDPDNNDGLAGNNDIVRVFQVGGSTTATTTAGGTVRVDGTGLSARILYTPPVGYEGPDSFTYTASDGRASGLGPLPGVSNSATVTLNVVDFVPKTVGGVVFIDGGFTFGGGVVGANNGQFDFIDTNGNTLFDPGEAGERTVMGAEIRLTGTSFQNDTPVDLVTHTDIDGKYSFETLTPPKEGTFYTVTEITPDYLVDGLDSPLDANDTSPVAGLIHNNGNDSFRLAWEITDQLGDITLRFGERGLDAGAINAGGGDSRGIITDILASSSSNGFVLSADSEGDFIWSWTLPGWGNAETLNIDLDPNNASATLSGTDRAGNAFSIRIHQNPALNTEANYASSTHPNVTGPYGPRFRILGRSGTNDYIIRIDGTAADFGLNLLAATSPAPAAEGESQPNVNPEFAAAADEVFGSENWA